MIALSNLTNPPFMHHMVKGMSEAEWLQRMALPQNSAKGFWKMYIVGVPDNNSLLDTEIKP